MTDPRAESMKYLEDKKVIQLFEVVFIEVFQNHLTSSRCLVLN